MSFSKGTDGIVNESPGFLGESPKLDPFSHHDLFAIQTLISCSDGPVQEQHYL